jgi:hypothetical protein
MGLSDADMNRRRRPHRTVGCGIRAGLGEGMPDLGYDLVFPAHNVGGSKSEQPDIGQEEPILAAIVFNEARAMRLAVVFETQSMIWVIQVGPAHEGTGFVPYAHLHRWTGQPTKHKQHPKARFHWRFCGALGELENAPLRLYALPACVAVDPLA